VPGQRLQIWEGDSPLDAHATVRDAGPGMIGVIVHAAWASGNRDYLRGLEVVLQKAQAHGLTLVDAMIVSKKALEDHPSDADRRVMPTADLAENADPKALASVLASQAARTARGRGAGGAGNPRKRLELSFQGSVRATSFESSLAGRADEEAPEAVDDTPGPLELQPFAYRADAAYQAGSNVPLVERKRHHETLVNDFASWLREHGLSPVNNRSIDIGLLDPPVIVEAKYVPDENGWASYIREAVGQLYEYRWFGQGPSNSANLVFLASRRPPDDWLRYLEEDRSIAVIWFSQSGFRLSARAESIFDRSNTEQITT
jgi:hypothetical protein